MPRLPRPRVLICAAFATLVYIVLPPLSAVAAEKAIWGPVDRPGGSSASPLYRHLGVDTYQASVNWATIASRKPVEPRDPDDPAYSWPTSLDRAVVQSRRYGIRTALLVTQSPAWANGGRSALWAPRASAYADFLTAVSRRYPSVRRWMIWGEPNSVNTFRPNRPGTAVGPRAYARLLDAAYGALKRASRKNIVIGGMTHTGGTVTPARFLRLMRLPSGRRPRLDWYGHNPFPISFPNLRKRPVRGGFRDISDLDTFAKEVAQAYRRRRPKLWLSEFVVQSDHPSRVFARSVSRAEQARWLRAAYAIADRLPSVAGLGWLGLLDEPEAPRSANWGLLTASGKRKPSFFAYRRAPSRRFRPYVSSPRPARGIVRGSVVRVRPRARGVVTLEIRSARGRLAGRIARRLIAGALWRVRISTVRLPRGRYTVVVDAPRGERVRRKLRVR